MPPLKVILSTTPNTWVAGASDESDLEMRIVAVSKARCHQIFAEGYNLKLKRHRRHQLKSLQKHLEPADIVVVYAFNTLADSAKEFLKIADQFKKDGIRLRSVSEPKIRPFTKSGKLHLERLYSKSAVSV